MRRRFAPGSTGSWRHRFVQIARELDGGARAAVVAAHAAGLRSRPGPGAASRIRARSAALAA